MRFLLRAIATLLLSVAPAAVWAVNKPPTVSLTSPTNGATFSAPANIMIGASASDPDGTVTRVDFYQGTTLIGTRTTAPYSMTWSSVAGGTYSLTAQATDNSGAAKTSSAVSITVTGPRILITTPASGATTYGSSIVVSGTFFGDAGSSTILVDNGNSSRLASIANNTYSATLPIYAGANTLRAVVMRRDRTSDSATTTVVGNSDPMIVFTSPAMTTFDAPANVAFIADAVSPAGTIAKVDFFRNGTLVGTASSPPYQYSWTNAASGSYTITATANDTNGHTGTVSLPITVNGANVPPAVSLTSPANGIVLTAPATISMAATASDPDGYITIVEFLKNGAIIGSTNVSPYAATVSAVPAGSYTLTARATDNRAAVATSAPRSITVVPANVPPTVSLSSPAAGATYVAPATISLSAHSSDSDGTVTKVDFYQGATLIGTATSAPYAANWANVAAGSYSLTAKATDNGGATTTSTAVGVTVNPNRPPTVSLTSPSVGSTYNAPATIGLAATAADPDGTIARVDFYQGTALIGSASAAPYTATLANVPAGSYLLTAQAIDNAGAATTSAAVSVMVRAFAVEVGAPSAGATIAADFVNVSGSIVGPPNSGVTVNGVVAAIDGSGRFYANDIPLTTGSNTVTATLTAPDGSSTSQAVTVTSTGPAPIRITATPTQGMSPLAVTFTAAAQPGVAIQKMEIDGDGNGSIDQTVVAADWSATITYYASGGPVINATIRVTDAQGNAYSHVVPIAIIEPVRLDETLRAVWNNMIGALAAGDKAAAIQTLSPSAQLRYGSVFDLLLPTMGQIVGSFSALQKVNLVDGLGEYAINRTINGENRLFMIYFTQDGDGVWRLNSM